VDSRQGSAWASGAVERTADERARLVRFCARLTGDPDAAEDLAQETLVRAWGQAEGGREPGGRLPWLMGIARHACLDWLRRRSRERARAVEARPAGREDDEPAPGGDALAERVADGVDLEAELERAELAALLDRALGLLPAETREVLVARYVGEASLAELAGRLGVSEGAVAMRLQRGKVSLRRLLGTRLRAEAEDFGLVAGREGERDTWQETRIWCPSCGARRLVGRFDARVYQLRCPACDAPGVYLANAEIGELGGLLGDVRRFKPALTRLLGWTHHQVGRSLDEGRSTCSRCGAPARIELRMPPDVPPSIRDLPGVSAWCGRCGVRSANGLGIVTLVQPAVRDFWQEHPRIRTRPRRALDHQGVAAWATRLESVTEAASIEVVVARATHRVLGVHRSS
jgi:RNA polymerase sigma-70 factor (ECF subfamily)